MACKCKEDEGCSCTFTSGFGVTLSGAGTPANPLAIDIDPYFLAVADTVDFAAVLEGDGALNNRYMLSFDLDPTLLEGFWDAWSGTSVQRDAIVAPDPDTIYVALDLGTAGIEADALYSGADAALRIYAGDVLVYGTAP